ncbi:5-bromo-4-chloroindolyl phosphate hydrolysis family protein [Viridibacillus sp. YIM B01967]|uniref:5-bromo-4-chloroindolyl phosphate hydrolysis family protein n=1 Tax=Viridibacillus soli TaxID=2798301 RepID=A0ABS1H3A3_9BACL|nr:5-bromo-4-chloroindolyl phosphate hydrolysis family protein [Viridibacillus soli]MBK3493891.1 5-bromo-4-chloroindolyl phosphate hydrolysis family protein [Viridibacillus soli]
MLNVGHFLARYAITIPFTFIMSLVYLFGFDLNFLESSGLTIITFFATAYIIKGYQFRKRLKIVGLTRSEYRHIKEQMTHAQTRIKSLNRHYTKVRSVAAFKQLFEMNRLAKRIFQIVRTNPKKFYQAEDFFYAHLESASELTEKYALLSTQPIKDTDVHIALQQTRETLEDLNHSMQDDLRSVLASDIEELKMELDFAQISTQKNKPLLAREENSLD